MEFGDFKLNCNGKKEVLNNVKHGVRKEQLDKKFHNLFDAYDANNNGTLETEELQGIFTGLTTFAGADKTLDTIENKQVANIFANQMGIKNADFIGFVRSVSDASEDIADSRTTITADGGKEVTTTYKDGSVETISYYPDGEFKFKKLDQKSTFTTNYYTIGNNFNKQYTDDEIESITKNAYEKYIAEQEQKTKQNKGFESFAKQINYNYNDFKNDTIKNFNINKHSDTKNFERHDFELSERAKTDVAVRDFILNHYVETHKAAQEALKLMGNLDNIGAAINAGTGELWNSIKNAWNGTDEEYQNFYELTKKFEPNYSKALEANDNLEYIHNHPEEYFRSFETNFKKDMGHPYNLENSVQFQQTTEQYQNAQILKQRIEILEKAMHEVEMYQLEQKTKTYAPVQNEGLNPASHIIKANKLLLQYFNNDQEAVNMILNGTINNAEATIKAISGIKNDTEKLHKTVLDGKTFEQIQNNYRSQYKAMYGTDFVPDDLTEKVMNAKATGGMVKLATITIISILITKSPIMAEISVVAGGAEATGAAANMIRTLVAKYGQTAVQQGIKLAMTSGTLATDVGLTLLNQVTSEQGVNSEELWESTKSSAKYIYFGAYIGAPLAQAVSSQLSRIGATARLFEGGIKNVNGAIQTTSVTGDKLMQNLMKGGNKVLTTGGAFLTDVTAFSALEIATEGIDPLTAGKEQTEMLGKLKLMNHFIEYMLGGKVHAGMNKARMDVAIEKSGVKNWNIKEIKTPNKTIYEVQVEEGLPPVRFNNANELTTAILEKVTANYNKTSLETKADKNTNEKSTKTTTSDLKKENIVENLEEAEKNVDSKKIKTQELNTDELEAKSNNTVPIDNLIKRYDEILKKATPTEEEILEFKNIQNELIGCGIFKPESKFTDIWESLKTNQFYQKYINPEFADFKALLNDTFKMIKENGFKIYKNKLNKQHLLLIFTAVITAPIPVPGTHLIAYILANKATKASSAKLNKLLEKARNAYQRYIKNPKPILETELNKACEEFTEEAFKHLDENYKVKENESHNTWLDENIDKLKESCQYSDDTGNLVERTLGKILSHLIQPSRFKILNYFIKNETLSKNKNLQKNTEYGATELEHLLMSVDSVQESKNIIDGFKYYISHENLHKNEIVQQYLNIILFNKNLSIEAKTKIFDLLSNPENSEILSKKASSLKDLLFYCDEQTDLDFAITVLLDKKANLQGLFNQAFNSINSKKELKDLYLNNKDNLAFTQELDKLAYYINDDNYQIAKPLINSKNIDIESKKNILKSTNEKNLEIAILLCNDKEFPKEHVAAILDKTTIDNLETAKELILDKNIPRDEIAVQLRIKNLNISNDEKNNIKEFLHNIKPYITKFSSNNNFMVQYLIDNPKISFADLNKYFYSINFKDLANKYPRIKNYTENELIQFITYHYKCGTTKFTDSELTLTNDFTKFIAENYISADDMTELLTIFPNTDRNIGTLPKGWNEDSAKDKALQHEISNIFEEFRLTGDTNTRNIDKLQKDLSNLLHKQVKVSYLGAGMFGTAYKISIEGAEDVCLKIFHTVPDREYPLHGKYIEPQALTFLNNHSNKFVKMFFGKVGASQDNDSFLVTQFLSDDTVPIDTYKGENSKVSIEIHDGHSRNKVKNKIIDPGGVDVFNEDVSAPKKAIEKAYNLKMNK